MTIPCHHRPGWICLIINIGVAAINAIVLSGGAALVSAAEDVMDVEIAELPPPYVTILFSIALVAGVGLLTGSLGDVIAEGM